MFESFITTKNNILDFTNKLKKLDCIDESIICNSSLDQHIKSLEDGQFKIALIAPFSAGKSTFINSLIGQDLLSMEITAETSVITKICFSQEIKVEIKYRNGEVEHIPGKGQPPLTINAIKEVLEVKTTVKGENTEDNIEEVKVYYPIEMCKDKVELVDTPGLFARHEKHKDITTNILPTVNAVVFMIEPESVGEKHFTEVIQNYVRNATSSNMEKEGRHIFFVINKIDKFEKEDIQKARIELEKVLEDIIPNPQVYEISAYYAMLSKMFLAHTIELDRIRKDKKIVIPDPEDPEYTLSGRNIEEEHVQIILDESRIRQLEKGLETYLEEKNRYLLVNLSNQIDHIINESKEHKKKELQVMKELAKEDKSKFEEKINGLQNEITVLENDKKRKIAKELADQVAGNSRGNGISDRIGEGIEESILAIQKKLSTQMYKDWKFISPSINKNNAEERISHLVNKIDGQLEILSKELVKTSYEKFKQEINVIFDYANGQIQGLKIDLENAELNRIGQGLSNMDSYNLDGVASSIKGLIEDEFSNTIVEVSKRISSNVRAAEDENTHKTERRGFFYGIKKFFTGRSQYETSFDINGFKREIEEMVNEIIEEINSSVGELEGDIKNMLEKPIQKIVDQVRDEINITITSLINNKKSLINNILKNMKNNEKENQARLKVLERDLLELQKIESDYKKIENQIREGK